MAVVKGIIMAGGSGTRLWPLSRSAHPKQFLSLHGNETMLQGTVKRLSDLKVSSSIVICNEEHRFFVAEQLREIDAHASIILEPVSRNTAPAIALAAFFSEGADDPLLLVLAADQVIKDKDAFTQAVTQAIPLAESGKLVTFGIVANEPNTGYGYIKKGASHGVGFDVVKFVEKPTITAATEYIKSGNYLWNSGMFLIKTSRYLEELNKFRSDIYDNCRLSVADITKDHDFLRVNQKIFEACPAESIDYAVMEKTDDAVVVPLDAGWSDIGSWSSLWGISKKDSAGNVIAGDVILHECRNSYFRTDGKLVAAIGLDDLVVVSTKDALVVAHKNSIDSVKNVVEKLKNEARPECELHREVYRPWGKYDSIDSGIGYQVKRLTVNPGAKLSVQKHHHRSEHWVVVSGTAKVHYGSESFDLNVNESTYHDKEVVHALENQGDSPLELIEVQVGNYLGEDDIVRFDDKYGRS